MSSCQLLAHPFIESCGVRSAQRAELFKVQPVQVPTPTFSYVKTFFLLHYFYNEADNLNYEVCHRFTFLILAFGSPRKGFDANERRF